MLTVPQLANDSGRSPRTIRAALVRLRIPKRGRDYLLSDEEAKAVLAEMRDKPGRPPSER